MRRYDRILLPYTLLAVPFLIIRVVLDSESLGFFLTEFTTISYWTRGTSAWFLALLFVLYAVAPVITSVLDKVGKYRVMIAFFASILIVFLCSLNASEHSSTADIIHNIQHAFKRTPSFLLGLAMMPCIKEHKGINGLVVLIISISVYFFSVFFFPNCDTAWITMWPVLILFMYALKYMGNAKLWIPVVFMGGITLESFLTNTYVGYICRHYINWGNLGSLGNGHYLEYSVVIIVGVFLAWLTNLLVKTIRDKQHRIK